MSLFAVLMLLCAGLLGGARGALATLSLAERIDIRGTMTAVLPVVVDFADPALPGAPEPGDASNDADPTFSASAELADVPPLPAEIGRAHV